MQKKRVMYAFTSKSTRRQRTLYSLVGIGLPQILSNGNSEKLKVGNTEDFYAIWDTGANCTAISETLIQQLNLPITSMSLSDTANGTHPVTVHRIDLHLPNGMIIKNLEVISAKLKEPIQVLIGMDVITMGDFAVSNFEDKTHFTFRIPSQADVDYVELEKARRPAKKSKIDRNSPCPCGSGKKYKLCHGRVQN